MKLTVFFLTAALVQVSARGLSQTVSFSGKDVPLQTVFSAVEKQTGYVFFYDAAILKEAKPVTVSARGLPLKDFVKLILQGQPLKYLIEKKAIIISRNMAPPPPVLPLPADVPPIDIHGRVTDSLGNPLVGASVTVKGSKKGASTDDKGEFDLKNVGESAVLVISYTSYISREIKLADNPGLQSGGLNIVLTHSSNSLDQVQIIAYGTTSQRLSTGDVTTVTSEDIEKQPVSNVLSAIEGQVPGLFITQQNGLPGASFTVAIRGRNSIQNGNDPFYVIDGVPYTSELITTSTLSPAAGNPFDFINPTDIESISVLKDADATAIYGSRAANGAILITTKKGKAGKLRLSMNLSQGIAQEPYTGKWLNRSQYLMMRNEAFKNDGMTPDSISAPDLLVWDTTRYTNWEKTLLGRTANYTNLAADVSGGNSNSQYIFGVTYHNESTVFPMSTGDQKGAAHWSLTSTTNDQKFKLVVMGNYMVDQKNLPGYDITTFLNTAPDAPPLYNPDGSLNWANSTWTNPLAYTKTSYKGTTNNLVANAILSYNIMKGLYLKSSFGYTYMETHESSLSPISSQDPAFSPTGSANFSDNNIHSWIVEPQASYLFLIGRSRFEALAGATFEDNSTNGQELSGTGYTSDVTLQSIYNAPEVRVATVTSDIYKYNALFGRLNYNYAEKYLLDFNWRRDGSSRFGPANQFHNFASVGAGWIFTKEDFFPKGVLSYGKLRGSYGTTGNDQIGDYRFYNLYAGAGYPYQGTTALIPTGLYNPNLAWELTKKAEVALELGFIHDRVLVSGSFYRDRSSNELLSSLLPSITGFNSIPENFPATVQNQGWEFSVNTINIDTKHFRWKTTFNFTMNKNKLIAFPNLSSNPNYANVYYVGKSITTSPVFHCLGVDPATGIYAFADSAGKETFNPSYVTDRVAFIDYAPKFYGGIGNSITFKGWQLDFFFQFRKQMGVNPLLSQFAAPGMFTNNMLKGVLSRWQNPGDKSSVEMFTQNFSSTAFTAYQYAQQSDLSVTDASYIRLSSVSLSYTLPGEWVRRWRGQGLQLFVRGQNLLTITKYPGMDPETQTISGLPVMRVITGGAQLSF